MNRLMIALLATLGLSQPVYIPIVVTPPNRIEVYVEYCIDGDTFMARVQNEWPQLSEAQLLRVTHLGAQAPGLNECYGPESLAIYRTLIEHTWVWLEWDANQTWRGDFVAHVWTQDGRHVSTDMLRYGVAMYGEPWPLRYRNEMIEAQLHARAGGRGAWGACQLYPPPTMPAYPYPRP